MNNSVKLAWSQYEAGKEYKRKIGLYETIRQNEKFYRGEQWSSGESSSLPHPVFNMVRRIIDYLVCSVASVDLSVRYTDESMSFLPEGAQKEALRHGLEILTANAAYRWERNGMDSKLLHMLTDAALTGDGILYCYWNSDHITPQLYNGDIETDIIDNVNVFVSDVNKADIQSQEYVIIAGRTSVAALKREALMYGASDEDIKKIVSDKDSESQSGAMASYELEGDDEAKATYIIKFWKEDGKVAFEKSTKECLIKRAKTDCRLYPVILLNWMRTKNSFHGTSPVTSLIPNQKYINKAYAMVMKHMCDTAFSKVIYDKSKIPEWSNEIGEAIAALGGGNISDAVSVVGVGKLEDGYINLIESAIEFTKDLMGATESALGDTDAHNTSAILALQETSRIPLEQVRSAYYKCIEDLANVWADMMCAYYPSERLIPYEAKGKATSSTVDISQLKKGFLCARIDVAEISRYGAVSVQNMLDKLLENGFISPAEYVRRLPAGVIENRDSLLFELEAKEKIEANTYEEEI